MIALLLTVAEATNSVSDTASLTSVRDSYPHLSPDGRLLLFQSNRSGRQAIWVAKADGSEPRILFDEPAEGDEPGTPVWAPNGKRIAFAMKPHGAIDPNESEIYTMQSDGAGLHRLTNAPGDDSHPHWSADGSRIFFNSARATRDLNTDWSRQWIDIYSMAEDGRDVRRHTNCQAVCTYPVPSPDGKLVAHRKVTVTRGQNWDLTRTMHNSEVFITPLDGSPALNVSNSPAFDGWPMWAPDGRWLVFVSNRDGVSMTGQIYRVAVDGSGLRRLTRGAWSRAQPSFSADGKRILVYESMEDDRFELGHIASFEVTTGQR
jgi:TolB protein